MGLAQAARGLLRVYGYARVEPPLTASCAKNILKSAPWIVAHAFQILGRTHIAPQSGGVCWPRLGWSDTCAKASHYYDYRNLHHSLSRD
jgi:hypothetical protein